MPPLNADERTTLESWLDFHRATLAMKCEGLDDEQAAVASAPPSPFTLTGLVQHMAEVERNWFRRVLAGETGAAHLRPAGGSGGSRRRLRAGRGRHLARRPRHLARGDRLRPRAVRGRALDGTGRFMGQDVSLRWIYVHLIEEYARHNGHADLLRERIDGITGV